MERALKKTISYRVLASIGGFLCSAFVYIFIKDLFLAVFGLWVFGELIRGLIYFLHEKWWDGRS